MIYIPYLLALSDNLNSASRKTFVQHASEKEVVFLSAENVETAGAQESVGLTVAKSTSAELRMVIRLYTFTVSCI